MRASMEQMVADWWREEQASSTRGDNVFVTGENQTKAQAASRYFFDSADRVHFFREATVDPLADADAPPPLNKAGHGLHLDEATPFGAYARSPKVAAVAREVAGLVAPVLPQSMYIFKGARVGGTVTSHQDGTFLYTRPRQTVVGFWLALHDAHVGNGCLWARPGSHFEPLRRRFVRTVNVDGEIVMDFENVTNSARGDAIDEEGLLSPALLGAARASSTANEASLADGEAARAWEGNWPKVESGEAEAEARQLAAAQSELSARGFVPLPVAAGDLVVFPGTLDHLSLPNSSPQARHTFQLHMVEGPPVEWAAENWLQYPPRSAFPQL